MTEEEVRACIFHDILKRPPSQLVSENKEMECTVTTGGVVGEGKKAWIWMVVIDNNESFNPRRILITTSKGVHDYIMKHGDMGISFKDLLDYKTLMDM